MKRKSIIALILAAVLSFGTAAMTGCNLLPDNTGGTEDNGGSTDSGGGTGDNTGGNTGDNTGGNTGDNTGGSTGDNTGGNNGDNTGEDSKAFSYVYAGSECAAFEWEDANPSAAKVEYKLSAETSYKKVDGQLVRAAKTAGKARADVLGLAGGKDYDFKVTTSAGAVHTRSGLRITSYDRSGYAHFNYNSGVGAYNDDGTPKAGAQIVYITEENKNSDITVGGQTYKGIVGVLKGNVSTSSTPLIVRIIGTVGAATWNHIEESVPDGSGGYVDITPDKVKGVKGTSLFDYFSHDSNGDEVLKRPDLDGEGKIIKGTGKGGDIFQRDLIDAGFNTLNTDPNNGGCSELIGLSSKIKYDASKDESDSCWNDCSVSGAQNVTVEGVGEDARIFQWGMTFKSSNSVEVRNLTFEDYTEDACSFEGSSSSENISNSDINGFTYNRFWVHNNSFEEGVNYWDVCNEQDKHDGDGSTDFKYLSHVTISYNHYIKTHKTGLIGGGSGHLTAAVTFHHNYYDGCKSRLPLARQANMHMYNNYYHATTSTDLSIRANGYAFVENCYFDSKNSTNLEIKNESGYGAVKVLGCTFDSSNGKKLVVDGSVKTVSGTVKGDHYLVGDATAENRKATVVNTNGYGTDFDTDGSKFYYDAAAGKTKLSVEMLATADVPTVIPKVAGARRRNKDGELTGGGSVVAGGSGSTEGGNTGGNTGGSETKTIVIANDFSAANGKQEYTLNAGAEASQYFDVTQIYLYTTNTSKPLSTTSTYFKMQSANKIKITPSSALPLGAKIVLTMDGTNEAEAVDVNGTNVNVVNGTVTFDIVSGTDYVIGRVSGETRIASISLIITV